mgnify:CR=1 FL=1
MRYVQLFTGCVVLILSAEIMVHEPVILSTRMGILPLVIGMAALAVGSSALELVVSVDANLVKAKGLAFTRLDLWRANRPNARNFSCVDLRQLGLHLKGWRSTGDWLIIPSMSKDDGPM